MHALLTAPTRALLRILVALAVLASPASAQKVTTFAAAARYSAEHEGDAVLVFRHDSLVFEQYQNGWDGAEPHPLASGTKTFACALAALARGDGLLTLDEPVARTLPEFGHDSLKRRVTIRELLNLTSGLEPELTVPVGNPDSAAVQLPMVARPGHRFAYGGASFDVFGELMSRKLRGEDLEAYLGRRIFAPLGIEVGYWLRDQAGHPHLPSGAVMTARAWGQFGLLLLDRGRWHGRQLVPRGALAECGHGSAANAWYGLGVWLNPLDPTRPPPPGVERAGPKDHLISARDLPHDLWLAAGAGGQRLYILASAGLVVVRFGHNTGPDYRDDVFLRTLLRH